MNFGMESQPFPIGGLSATPTLALPPNRVNSSTNTPPDNDYDQVKEAGGGKLKRVRSTAAENRTNLFGTTKGPIVENGINSANKTSSLTQGTGLNFSFRSAWPLSKFTMKSEPEQDIPEESESDLENDSDEVDAKVIVSSDEGFAGTTGSTFGANTKKDPVKIEPIPFSFSSSKAKE